MFISEDFLGIQYGVDHKIAQFFVDREPPVDNLYWKDKYLYLRPSPGYLFIPLIVDILFKTGIGRQQLLSGEFIGLMEQIGHISALEETKQITNAEAIERCEEAANANCKNENWLKCVTDYFKGAPDNQLNKFTTPFKALHRGDVFLFSLCTLNFAEDVFEKVAKNWFALISSLLLLDDAEDMYDDKNNHEENAFLESGLDKAGIEKVKHLISYNLKIISSVNPIMAKKIDAQFIQLSDMPHIQPLLNQ